MRERGASFAYQLEFVDAGDRLQDDTAVEADGVLLYIDAESAPRIEGATLEYVDDVRGSGFKFENPNRTRLAQDPLAARVQQVLDERINPGIAAHGGHVALIDVREGRVFLEMGGGCQGCGMADVTLRQGIETMLREEVPEVAEVLDTTDHAAGTNPYYQPGK